jgi:hypothetical protein
MVRYARVSEAGVAAEACVSAPPVEGELADDGVGAGAVPPLIVSPPAGALVLVTLLTCTKLGFGSRELVIHHVIAIAAAAASSMPNTISRV